jgi:CHAT domain-containing protein/tetratricopeptide (TPR) repeat protein
MADVDSQYKTIFIASVEAAKRRDFVTATRLSEQAVDIARCEFGTSSDEFFQAFHILAVATTEDGNTLVGRALLEWLLRNGQDSQALKYYAEIVCCMLKDGDRERAKSQLAMLLPELSSHEPLMCVEALTGIGNAEIESGHYEEAVALYRIVADLCRYFPVPYRKGEALYNLGSCLFALGDEAQAISCLTEALNIFRSVLGDSHYLIGETSFLLGMSFHRIKNFEKAAAAYRLMLRSVKLNDPDANLSSVIGQLKLAEMELPPENKSEFKFNERVSPFAALVSGLDIITAKRFEEVVRSFYSRDYVKCAEIALDSMPKLARYDVIQFLIFSLERLGEFELIPAVGRWALTVSNGSPYQYLITFLLGHHSEAEIRQLTESYISKEEIDFAVAVRLMTSGQRESAKLYLDSIIQTKPRSLAGISSLVEKYFSNINVELPSESEAGKLRRLAAQLDRNLQLDEHQELVKKLTDEGEFDKALTLQQQLVSEFKKDADLNPIPYAMALNNLAHILFENRQFEEALPFYELCVETLRSEPDCLEGGDAANNLGNIYFALNRFADAEKYHELSLEMRLRTYGNHPRVLLGLLDLAHVYRQSNNLALNGIYEQCLACIKEKLGAEFPQLFAQLQYDVRKALSKNDWDSAHQAIRQTMYLWEAVIQINQEPAWRLEAGIAHQKEGRIELAISFIRLAAKSSAQLGLHDIELASLIELGHITFNLGNIEDSSNFVTLAWERIKGKEDYFSELHNRLLLLTARCLAESKEHDEQSLNLLLDVINSGENATAATRLSAYLLSAELLMNRADLAQATKFLQEAVGETNNLSATEAIKTLCVIASKLMSCDSNRLAAECLERVRALISVVGEIDETQRAAFLSIECSQAISTAQYAQAYDFCQEALHLLSKQDKPDFKLRAKLLEDYARIAVHYQSNWKRAADALQLAINEYEKFDEQYEFEKARLRIFLAKALLATSEFRIASSTILEAVNGLRKIVPSNNWLYADALSTAGRINLRIGATKTAEAQLIESKEIFTKLFGSEHGLVTSTGMELGTLYLQNEMWLEALNEARLSISSLNNLGSVPTEALITCQEIESRANFALGNIEAGLNLMSESIFNQLSLYLRVAHSTNNETRMSRINSIRDRLDELLTMAWKSGKYKNKEWAEHLFLAVVRSKRLATEFFSKQEEKLYKISDEKVQQKLSELREMRALFAQSALTDPTQPLNSDERDSLFKIQKTIDRLEFELSLAVPELISYQDLLNINIESISSKLAANQSIVAFVKFDITTLQGTKFDPLGLRKESRYLAFTLKQPADGDDPVVHTIDLGAAEELDDLVDEYITTYLKTFRKPGAAVAKLIFERLMQPLLGALGSVKELYIVPDGILCSVPFEAIPVDGEKLLADLFEITYLEAVRDLFKGNDSVEAPSPPIVIADPDYSLAESEQNSAVPDSSFFTQLPGAAEEGRLVAELLKTNVITGEAANETRIKSLSSPRILHLATHGYYFPAPVASAEVYESIEMVDVPGEGTFMVGSKPQYAESNDIPFHNSRFRDPTLRSGMVLAGANTWLSGGHCRLEAEDGFLSVADIMGLNLRSTELVVLSACETGLGIVDDSEGVLGVRRAFVIAGARSVVCSLWKVPDEATKQLMICFYSFINNGIRPAAALKLAKNKMRENGFIPREWSGFIHIGKF